MEDTEILEAVDKLLKVHDAWAESKDPAFKDILPGEFEDAAEDLFATCSAADVPAQCRDLVRAIEDLEVQWRLYANGAREQSGGPKNSLWRAFRAVIAARILTSELRPKTLEPVAELLRQGVTPNQIANSIYGYQGKGPFLENGSVRHDLIQKERETPGSVVEKDWIPPYEEERLRRHHIITKNRLGSVDDRMKRNAPPPVQSSEALLREGQYVDVIAKTCNLTEKQVLAIAAALEIEPQYRPNLTGPERGSHERPIAPEDSKAMDAYANNPAAEPAKKIRVPKGTQQKVMELFEAGLGAPEIAERIGNGLTPQAVAQMIRKSSAPA